MGNRGAGRFHSAPKVVTCLALSSRVVAALASKLIPVRQNTNKSPPAACALASQPRDSTTSVFNHRQLLLNSHSF